MLPASRARPSRRRTRPHPRTFTTRPPPSTRPPPRPSTPPDPRTPPKPTRPLPLRRPRRTSPRSTRRRARQTRPRRQRARRHRRTSLEGPRLLRRSTRRRSRFQRPDGTPQGLFESRVWTTNEEVGLGSISTSSNPLRHHPILSRTSRPLPNLASAHDPAPFASHHTL